MTATNHNQYTLRGFVSLASNELLRSIVVSDKKRDRPYKFYAKEELARRDRASAFDCGKK